MPLLLWSPPFTSLLHLPVAALPLSGDLLAPAAQYAADGVCAFMPIPLAWLFAHCSANPIYVFSEKELRGLSHNFHIHMSLGDLYIPRIAPHIFLQQNRQTDRGNIYD
jgi:hypothetical protein